MPIFIMDGELIVGNTASKPYALELDLGFGEWNQFEIDSLKEDGFKLDARRKKKRLQLLARYPQFWRDQRHQSDAVGERSDGTVLPLRHDPSALERQGGQWRSACSGIGLGPGWILMCPDYDLALHKGVNAMIRECEEELQAIHFDCVELRKIGHTSVDEDVVAGPGALCRALCRAGRGDGGQ